mgnify:CR=1 FL=1
MMNHLLKSSLIVAIFFGIDKIFGFIRQVLVARQFSLSYDLDVFNAANNIPDLLSSLISGGALGVALIPVLSEYITKNEKNNGWLIFSQIANLAFLVTGSIALFLSVFAPWIVDKIVAPGFPPEQKKLTVELMRLDLIAILIFSISGLIMAGLQANQHFLLPAAAPALYNIGQIIGIVILAPSTGYIIGPIQLPAFGLGIRGLVYGVIFGAVLHLLVQTPGLIKYGFRWSPQIQIKLIKIYIQNLRIKFVMDIKHPGVRKVLSLLGPRVMTMLFIQLFFIIRDNLASKLGEGSVTALNYGWFIMQVPETLIGTATAIVLLPTISELFASGQIDKFTLTINTAVKFVLALTIPCALLLIATIEPMIKMVFDFDVAGTQLVTAATRMYLLGLAGHALLEIATRSFYAQQNAKIPLYAAAFNAAFYFIFANIFSSLWGVVGIALANVTVFTLEALILFLILNYKFRGIFSIHKTFLRVLLASVVISTGLYSANLILNITPLAISILGIGIGSLLMIPVILPELKIIYNLKI